MNFKKIYWFLTSQLHKVEYGRIGKKSYLADVMFVQRKKNLFIGDNTRIYPGLRAEICKRNAAVKIGSNVSIGQNFHVVSYEGAMVIPDNVVISGNVFISNVDHDYHEIGKHIYDQKMIYRKTEIGEGCFIGYGAVILPGTKLGKQCIVGANSVVKGTFPDYCVIAGSPARIVKQYDKTSKKWEKR